MINYYDTDGQKLVDRFYDSMRHHRGVTIKGIAEKTGIPASTIYSYLREPQKAPLVKLMKILRLAGIKQVTFQTGGTYSL